VVLAVLLDLDGTLMDTFDVILDTMNAAMAEAHERPFAPQELRPVVGIPAVVQLGILRGIMGSRAESIANAYYREFIARVEKGVRLYPGVRRTMAVLAKRRVGTMTTRRADVARLMLRVAGIDQHFRAIVGGDEVDRPKPDPDLPLHAAKAVGAASANCVVVGDNPVDIQAGRAAGMRTVAATYGYGDLTALREAGPTAELPTFADLPDVLAALERRRTP
jgi:2-phosphoglycolate phosphatase